MAVDPVTGRLLLMGGTTLDGQSATPTWGPNDGTWLWSGSDWSRVADNPRQGGHPALATDVATGQLIVNCPNVLGVETPSGYGPDGPFLPSPEPTWAGSGSFRWTGSAWVLVAGSSPLMLNAAIGYDPISRRVIQFGGNSQGADNQTAAYDGSGWAAVTPAHVPPPGPAAAATDETANRLLLVAGSVDHPALATTWTWNGSDWVRQSVNEPPASAIFGGAPAMTWDPAVGGVVLIGNASHGTAPLGVWLWLGATQGWQQLAA
jgi:hypothetical protein